MTMQAELAMVAYCIFGKLPVSVMCSFHAQMSNYQALQKSCSKRRVTRPNAARFLGDVSALEFGCVYSASHYAVPLRKPCNFRVTKLSAAGRKFWRQNADRFPPVAFGGDRYRKFTPTYWEAHSPCNRYYLVPCERPQFC